MIFMGQQRSGGLIPQIHRNRRNNRRHLYTTTNRGSLAIKIGYPTRVTNLLNNRHLTRILHTPNSKMLIMILIHSLNRAIRGYFKQIGVQRTLKGIRYTMLIKSANRTTSSKVNGTYNAIEGQLR